MATVAAVGPADALEIKSSDVHAMGYPTTDAIQFMGEWLSEKTDGELSINIFHSMQLGALEMTLAPLILICTPILLPVIKSIGVDPVHFGFIIMLNLGIGLVTPPVSTTLFVGFAIGKIPIDQAARGLWPFWLAMFVVLMLVTYFEPIAMTMPRWVTF